VLVADPPAATAQASRSATPCSPLMPAPRVELQTPYGNHTTCAIHGETAPSLIPRCVETAAAGGCQVGLGLPQEQWLLTLCHLSAGRLDRRLLPATHQRKEGIGRLELGCCLLSPLVGNACFPDLWTWAGDHAAPQLAPILRQQPGLPGLNGVCST